MTLWQRFKAWFYGIEHAAIEDIMRPLTRIRDALRDHANAADDAAFDAHEAADALREDAHTFRQKAGDAARQAAKLNELLGIGLETVTVQAGSPASQAEVCGPSPIPAQNPASYPVHTDH